MSHRPADRLLIRAQDAVRRRAELVFIEAVPWRTEADDPALIAETVPGAHRVSVREVFAGRPHPGSGHLPLPDAQLVRDRAAHWRRARPNDSIVVFSRDARDLTSATRAWFVLSWAGVAGVRVLLGGLDAWERAGGSLGVANACDEITTAPADGAIPQPSAPQQPDWPVRVIEAETLLARAANGSVLDARPATHYAGFIDDPRSGHVPGAVSAPATDLVDADGTVRSPSDLRRWLLERGGIGGHPVAAYCHGGVASSSLVFAGALLGQEIDLYVDSWSAWAERADLPVAHGFARGQRTGDDFSCFDPL